VYTDEGIVGIGEVDSSPQVAKAIIEAPLSHKICCGLAELIIGEDPVNVEYLWNKMYQGSIFFGRRGAAIQAMSGIDIALWDILGKATGEPVYRLLGGAFRKKFRAYASILFGDTPEETRNRGVRHVAEGCTAVKFGWGPIGQGEETDIAHVREARRGLGDTPLLLVDAGICWDAVTAIRRARQFQEFDIFWLEEPLHPDDLEGYAKLASTGLQRIAAGEQESTRASFRELMDIGCVDVIQPDVARVGGLTEAKKIGFMAADRHKLCVNHSYKTGISVAASLHFLSAIPNSELLEYCVEPSPLRQTLTVETFPIDEQGMVNVPEGPGLGVTLNEETVERYRLS
ncbi:MAG: mandelate racemase/muconate lactonizing enzyme family protein, partial [Candidatus Latescibacteria bacterium]|nr:mandelate racemase/muconate lactonizing enzyme family protein [Candidatus Latescibacterota bacterium]